MSALVGLSFDDGPSVWTEPVLELLAAHDARATFFVIGSVAEAKAELLARIVAAGHEIGNHSWSHPALARDCTSDQVRAELLRTNQTLARITGAAPTMFRAPHYDHDARVDAIAAELGLRHVDGDVTPPDWRPGLSAKVIATLVLGGAVPGAVIGLHDGIPPREASATATRQPTVDALAAILPALSERGLRCRSVSELWAA
jgi:peptidoglycan/xylan/chitin deacetylase (PgdA/CDA1 family)